MPATGRCTRPMREARRWRAPSGTELGRRRHCQVVLAPPFTALAAVAEEIKGSSDRPGGPECALGAQRRVHRRDQHPDAGGCGCGMVIIGHSERRQYFGETDETVNRRVQAVLNSSLQPIVCIGETLAEREAGQVHNVITQQLAGGLDGLTRQTCCVLFSPTNRSGQLVPGVRPRLKLLRKCTARSAIGFPDNSATRRPGGSHSIRRQRQAG